MDEALRAARLERAALVVVDNAGQEQPHHAARDALNIIGQEACAVGTLSSLISNLNIWSYAGAF
jgi:hypothetical protein